MGLPSLDFRNFIITKITQSEAEIDKREIEVSNIPNELSFNNL